MRTRMATPDETYREPPNSTVDDWLGQRVMRDEARAEKATKQAGGDLNEAERRFENETEAKEYQDQHDQ
ncbi:MAG: hypothetical protein QOJ19_1431 [Acidimicrobiia bacterium]|nr:hypothetical protein [Acidimicrobiia bacterium]